MIAHVLTLYDGDDSFILGIYSDYTAARRAKSEAAHLLREYGPVATILAIQAIQVDAPTLRPHPYLEPPEP